MSKPTTKPQEGDTDITTRLPLVTLSSREKRKREDEKEEERRETRRSESQMFSLKLSGMRRELKKDSFISSLYQDDPLAYTCQYAFTVQEWKDRGLLDLNRCDITNISNLTDLKRIAWKLLLQDVWGLRARAKLMRVDSDISRFIQLISDDDMKSDSLRMMPTVTAARRSLITMASYLREVFYDALEDYGESLDTFFKQEYYSVRRAIEYPDMKLACKFLLEPIAKIVRNRCATIESRYLNLLLIDRGCEKNKGSERADVAARLMKVYGEFRRIGRDVVEENDYLTVMATEQSYRARWKLQQQQKQRNCDVHDDSFAFYVKIFSLDQELNRIGDTINEEVTDTEEEFNLFMDANKIGESRQNTLTDESFDFSMIPMAAESVDKLYWQKVEDDAFDIREYEIVEFMKLVYAFEIAHRGGVHVYKHPLAGAKRGKQSEGK